MQKDYVLATSWVKVDKEDFYLSDEWTKKEGVEEEDIKKIKSLQKEGKLYEAYIVGALEYCIYYQMDADKVYINDDMDVVLRCESYVTMNDHIKVIEYNY